MAENPVEVGAEVMRPKLGWETGDTVPLIVTAYCWFMLYNHEWDKAACLFVTLVWMLGWDISRSLRRGGTLTINTTIRQEAPK